VGIELKKEFKKWLYMPVFSLAFMAFNTAQAQDQPSSEDADLAQKLANPLASLVSVPFQFNYDDGYGTANGKKSFFNIQPIVPFELNSNLTLVTRTIIPVIWQKNISGLSGSQFGLGDTTQSFWFVPGPKKTSLGTFTWGVGPVIQWPTSTNALLGSGTLGLGATFIILFQKNGWTYGTLVTKIWGVAKTRSGTPDLNILLFQPFLSYTTKTRWTFTVNAETSYDATAKDFSLPINLMVNKLTSVGSQKVQFQVGGRYYVNRTVGGPDGWGFRFAMTLLFPG